MNYLESNLEKNNPFFRSLEHFFLKLSQKNFWKKNTIHLWKQLLWKHHMDKSMTSSTYQILEELE